MIGRTKGMGLLVAAALAMLVAACDSSGSETPEYRVTVNFTEEVTQQDMDAVGDYLRGFDPDLDFLILEIFPPIGSATVATDADGFCETVVPELESRGYVSSASCEPYVEPEDGGDPDEPVTSEPDDASD